jgi:hypothetical protein
MKDDFIWAFVGENARFPSGLFSSIDDAKDWIALHKLSGVLTKYPLNKGVCEWAIEIGIFTPKKPEHSSSTFVGRFSSAGMEHYHFENGVAE